MEFPDGGALDGDPVDALVVGVDEHRPARGVDDRGDDAGQVVGVLEFPGVALVDAASFVLAEAAPHAVQDSTSECPGGALFDDGAAVADALGCAGGFPIGRGGEPQVVGLGVQRAGAFGLASRVVL